MEELRWRGLVHQVTDPDVEKLLDSERLTAYIGFDPTADSLHVGNLLQICNLRRLQLAGHRPIALAGGGTGMVGDPGGRTSERSLLTPQVLEANLAAIRTQLGRFLDFEGGRALLVNNGDWLWSLGLLEFLRDVGKHFTVNQMVAKESVRARLERPDQGISYTEFSYMLLQAYDFSELFARHGCRLQLGGSDQWGNITMGIDLIRRLHGEAAYGLTSPLVLRSDGTKFGKSAAGESVWLDAHRTSPYDFYQHFVRTEDALVGTYLRYFTFLPRERIEELDAATKDRPKDREAQRALAHEVTALVHGEDEAKRAAQAAEALFVRGSAAVTRYASDRASASDSATVAVTTVVPDGTLVVDALVQSGLAATKSEARRFLEQGGVYINETRAEGLDRRLSLADAVNDYVRLRRGKKEHRLVRFEESFR